MVIISSDKCLILIHDYRSNSYNQIRFSRLEAKNPKPLASRIRKRRLSELALHFEGRLKEMEIKAFCLIKRY